MQQKLTKPQINLLLFMVIFVFFTFVNMICTNMICKSKINKYIDSLSNENVSKNINITVHIQECQKQNANQVKSTPTDKNEIELSLYNKFTDDEIHLIEATVQHEVGDFSETYQTLIAELIYNRLLSEEFPNTIQEVIFQENQFTGIEEWYNTDIVIQDNVKNVVETVFNKPNTSHEAIYYYNPELSCDNAIEWFEYSGDVELLFEHTEESWGVSYTTRFFKEAD